MQDIDIEQGAMEKAITGLVILFAVLVYVFGWFYADAMFLQVMMTAMPEGILRGFAIAGAVTTAVSACVILAGKFFWFAPGWQTLAAIVFWIVELVVGALNTILAFHIAERIALPGYLEYWYSMCPATPLVSIVGIGIVLMLDPRMKIRNMMAKLRQETLASYAQFLANASKSKEVQDLLIEGAQASADQFTKDMFTGKIGTGDRVRKQNNPAAPAPFAAKVSAQDVPAVPAVAAPIAAKRGLSDEDMSAIVAAVTNALTANSAQSHNGNGNGGEGHHQGKV